MQNVLLRIKDNSNNILYTVQWLISSESDQGKGDIKREEGSNSGPVQSEYVSAQDSCDPKGVSIDCKQDHSQDEAARHYEVAEENWTTSKNFRLHRQNDPSISCGSSNLSSSQIRAAVRSPVSTRTPVRPPVSTRTVRRRLLVDFKLPSRRPAKKAKLSKKNIKDRLAFCRKYKNWTKAD